MKLQLYYFSGTGNSLYIARELQKKFSDSELTSILHVLKTGNFDIKGDVIGLVFPLHAFTMPIPVKNFLEKIDLSTVSYIFTIATRGGSPSNVFSYVDKILSKKNKKLDSYFFIDMPNNFTHVAQTPTSEEIKKQNAQGNAKLEQIKDIVSNKDKFQDKSLNKSLFRKRILFPILSSCLVKTGYLHTDKKFYTDSHCTGCGLCTKLCLADRIRMKESKPYWKNDSSCIYCLACFNYCPNNAIQIRGSKSAVKGRYHHPQVSWKDISMQAEKIL